MKALSEQEMLHRLAAYCSSGERCRHELEEKIRKAGLSGEAGRRIIARLLEEKYIDERRYARSFVNDKLRFNKWGRVKIGCELRRKHISAVVIGEALEGIDNDEYHSILATLLKAKQKRLSGSDARRAFGQLFCFATGRGFESKDILQCLRQLFNGNDYAGDLE